MIFNYDKLVNPDRPYIIAEIGSNHNGDIDLAKRMIDAAKDCGADCVKFQSWSKESIFSRIVYEDNYFLKDDYRNRKDYTLEEIVDEYSIDSHDHEVLYEHCKQAGIDFSSSSFSRAEVDLLVDEFDVPFIKVASMDVDNVPLLEYLAKKNKPVVISTGLSKMSEVSKAIECLEDNGCTEIALLHCVSLYPPDVEQVNLNNIDMLKICFEYPVGYSDHTLGFVAPILSLAKRPCIIEKHFTLDKEMIGWDHKVSADESDLRTIAKAAHDGFSMLGSFKKVQLEDNTRRNAFRRSIVAAHDIKEGDIIKECDIDYKRPGSGISPANYRLLIGRRAKRDIRYDDLIQPEDF